MMFHSRAKKPVNGVEGMHKSKQKMTSTCRTVARGHMTTAEDMVTMSIVMTGGKLFLLLSFDYLHMLLSLIVFFDLL